MGNIDRRGRRLERRRAASRRLGGDFWRLWVATASSNTSDGVRAAALPLLAATLTRDPGLVAGVYLAGQLPWLLFGLVAGAIVDRHDRRRLVVGAHLSRAAAVVLLAASVAGGWVSIPLLYAGAFALGVAETLFDNGAQALLPELVPSEDLPRANARLEVAMLVGQRFAGPPLGAALFAAAAVLALAADAFALLLAAVAVLAVRGPRVVRRAPASAGSLRRDVADGARWLLAHPLLRTVSFVGAVVNFFMAAVIAVFVLFALDELGVGEIGYALLLVVLAVGGVLGSILAPAMRRRLGSRRAITLAVAVAGAAQLLSGLASAPVLVGALQLTLAAAASVWAVVTTSLRQALAPADVLGRVIGAHRLLSWGGGALGAAAGGLVAELAGVRAPFVLGGVVLLALAAPTHRLLVRASTALPRHGAALVD